MTRRRGESQIRWLKRIAETFVLRGFPAFRTGDRVAIVDPAARTVLGDDTGTVEEVVAPFYGWEFRVVADNPDPDAWLANVQPDEGQLLTAEQIEPITSKESGQ
ncbi:MAG TPA: hypothetical protein VFJ06_14215 [Halococcus sp.]|nr:hypothetical protein [Halococcus sp.]